MEFYQLLKQQLTAGPLQKIVFPEGDDQRVQQAAAKLGAEGLLQPILFCQKTQPDLAGVKVLDPQKDLDLSQLAQLYQQLVPKDDQAARQKALADVSTLATLFVKNGQAQGMVSGAAHSTADTVRPALKIIKPAPGMKRVSGAFLMEKDEQQYVFADCAMNIDPDAATLAEIAYQSALTAKMVGLTPKVAFLSFSTKRSAAGPMVDKVVAATALFKTAHPEIAADGDLQFDAAIVPAVAAAKAPDSKVTGQANVFIFPEIQSGNIGYKLAQRLGNFSAVGPILQGLAAPINDLSRGASSEDIYRAGIMTAAQALRKAKQ
jgi:phosphate acetyltransferase